MTQVEDFNHDGDGACDLVRRSKQAKQRGVAASASSARRGITHATPAATFAHIDNCDDENAIALQAPPGAMFNNRRNLKVGVDVTLWGGGRQ